MQAVRVLPVVLAVRVVPVVLAVPVVLLAVPVVPVELLVELVHPEEPRVARVGAPATEAVDAEILLVHSGNQGVALRVDVSQSARSVKNLTTWKHLRWVAFGSRVVRGKV